ncbi:MAG: DMT family transporter [Burkholderiaceae bacterium]
MTRPPASPLPVLALTLNALVWGTAWWPFRRLESFGLHPLWATALVFTVSALAIVAWRPQSMRQLLRTPVLWILVFASGTTNAAFNWAVVVGDVVRVVLLFYLMPLWSVLLARLLLKEPLTRGAALRVALALAGAAVVLWPAGGLATGLSGGWPPRTLLADVLALLGGFSFALNNVMLRREAHQPEEARALAMFVGGVLVAGLLATTLALQSQIAWPPLPRPAWLRLAFVLALLFLAGNLALQYGAARLPAHVTAVVMLTEVVFASGSAWLLGAGRLTPQLLAGGALIVLAALHAAWRPEAAVGKAAPPE